jgi:hypothetical protein
MLGNLILFLIMLISIVMRLLALDIKLISKCLKRRLLMHPMNIAFHSKLLMHLLCLLAKYVGGKRKSPKTCVWVPKVLVYNVKGPKTVWVPKNKA